MPQLILINGPAGIGKTTIAQRYIAEHPFALLASVDDVVGALGQWLTHEPAARKLAFSLVTSMVTTHLKTGHDVVVPLLLEDPAEADVLATIAQSGGATFFEFALLADKPEAIQRMFEKGAWGEPGSPPLTAHDAPIIEGLYDRMQAALAQRPHTVRITSVKNDIDGTYQKLLAALTAADKV